MLTRLSSRARARLDDMKLPSEVRAFVEDSTAPMLDLRL
jgi:hypothetical protein